MQGASCALTSAELPKIASPAVQRLVRGIDAECALVR